MLNMIIQDSVILLGGKRPYPMLSMCDMALKTAQLYLSQTLASYKNQHVIVTTL